MCVAIPSLVVEVQEGTGTVDVGGARRRISLLLLPDARVGDFVIVHAGFALKKIDEQEAQETLRILGEMAASVLESDPEGYRLDGPSGEDQEA